MESEWLIEIVRTDGEPVSAEEVMRAWDDPGPWRRPAWLSTRPGVEADGRIAVAGRRCRVLGPIPQPSGNRLLFAADKGAGTHRWAVEMLVQFKRLCASVLPSHRARAVCRLRGWAYCGPIPNEVARHTRARLAYRFRLVKPPWWTAAWNIALGVLALSFPISAFLDGSLRFDPAHPMALPLLTFPLLVGCVAVILGVRALADAVQLWVSGETSHSRRVGMIDPTADAANGPEQIAWAALGASVCHACEYDLRASAGPRCPECGHPNLRWWCEQGRLAEAGSVLPDTGGAA